MSKLALPGWVKDNRVLLWNASSLIGTTTVTSGLGFVYWWLAARLFPTSTVGIASSAISAMMFLSTAGMLGMDTLLIGELSRNSHKADYLITGSLLIAGVVAGLLGIVFAMAAPLLSPELSLLAQEGWIILLFAAGVSCNALVMIVDQSLIGLLRGGLQLWRNGIFASVKLIALGIVFFGFVQRNALIIYATWIFGNILSLAVLYWMITSAGKKITWRLDWQLVRRYSRTSLDHFVLNLSLRAPSMILPIVTTILLSATTSAAFFIAWMIANFVFVIPAHLSTALYAVGANKPELFAQKLRMTLKTSFVAGVTISAIMWLGSDFVLNLFGSSYAQQAAWSLRILSVGIFPLIIRFHYVAICRVHGQIVSAAKLIMAGSLLSIILAALGALVDGLIGLTMGWLIGACAESLIASLPVYRAAVPKAPLPVHPIIESTP